MAVPFVLGVILFIAHYFSRSIHVRHRAALLSFSVGVSLGYVFLYLLPEIVSFAAGYERGMFAAILAGLAVTRVAEIHVRRHKRPDVMRKELREVHSAGFLVYSFVTGMLISEFFALSAAASFLFFVPLVFHAIAGSASINEIHQSLTENRKVKAMLSVSPLAGITAGYFFSLSGALFAAVLGLIVGIMLYIVMRDSMPKESQGRPGYFLAGILLCYMLIEASFAIFR